MEKNYETQVLVVGAGPVGLTLATDLAQRGVRVVIAESRPHGEPPNVKSNHVSARTMEIFRRLGVARAVRDAGLPAEHSNDVAYRTTFTGEELSRIHIPSRATRYSDTSGPDGWWPTPEPPHRINQIYLEPILFAYAQATHGVSILNRTQVEGFIQTEEGVNARAINLDTGMETRITCQYMIGCDGGRSTVRKAIGATLSGTAVVGRVQSTFLRAPDLLSRTQYIPAWATFSINPRRSGNVYAIDGRETFLVHNYLRENELDFDAVDRDWAIREILGVDKNFRYEIISKEDWIGRRLVANKFRDKRVFIAGDASHLWVPMAGYGMNAGIADATNLSWKLAARLNGWGAEGILDAYEAERLPITEQVSKFAMNHALALQSEREHVPAEIEANSIAGKAAREKTGKALYELNVKQYCCAGLNFGYFYDASPLIAYDGEPAPAYEMDRFTPSTAPGCRTPHFWLPNGRSIYDAMGPEYTLLRFDTAVDVSPLVQEASRVGVPLRLLDVSREGLPGAYCHSLVLSRPDRHIAWRGNRIPEAPALLVEHIRGRATAKPKCDTTG